MNINAQSERGEQHPKGIHCRLWSAPSCEQLEEPMEVTLHAISQWVGVLEYLCLELAGRVHAYTNGLDAYTLTYALERRVLTGKVQTFSRVVASHRIKRRHGRKHGRACKRWRNCRVVCYWYERLAELERHHC